MEVYIADLKIDFTIPEKTVLASAINKMNPGPVAELTNLGMYNAKFCLESVNSAIKKQQLNINGEEIASSIVGKIKKALDLAKQSV